MRIVHGCVMIAFAGACADSRSTGWLDTGDLESDAPILALEGTGWLGGRTRTTSATRRTQPRVSGWPVAACLDVVADGRCDFASEPFAMCDQEERRVRCHPRPWKLTLTRTQVFDGAWERDAIALTPRVEESAVHASFSAHQLDGIRAQDVDLCAPSKGLCSSQAADDEAMPPLQLCGVDGGATALDLVVGGDSRRVDADVPRPLEVSLDWSRSVMNDLVSFRIESDVAIDQVLVQIRAPSDAVLWTSANDAGPRRARGVIIVDVPASTLFGAPDAQLLVQVVALEQRVDDRRLLVQAITEVRVWVPLALVPSP
jgi:hypothetical protein